MPPETPRYCNPTAFRDFQNAVTEIDNTDGLTRAAVAISSHLIRDASLEKVEATLDDMAKTVLNRVPSGNPQGLIANAHELMFDDLGYRGNSDDYYNPRNSCLPSVIASRRGIPITLTLVYKATCERIGLKVEGLNCPGHFLAYTKVGQEEMIIDPFRGGMILTVDEARSYIEEVVRHPVMASQIVRFASHTEWIARILHNLQNLFSMQSKQNDLLAMQEIETLLPRPN